MPDVSDVNEAKALAERLDEQIFSESVLLTAAEEEIGTLHLSCQAAKEQYDDAALQANILEVYYTDLSIMLGKNGMPNNKEDAAREQARNISVDSQALSEHINSLVHTLNVVQSLLKQSAEMSKALGANTSALVVKATEVIHE